MYPTRNTTQLGTIAPESGFGKKSSLPPNFDINIGGRRPRARTISSSPRDPRDPTPINEDNEDPVNPVIMAQPGPFPPLKNVKEVREFDGSSETLSDFSISVDSIIAAYNLPVQYGGYVRGNMDDGWVFVKYADHQINPAASRLNLPYGSRFCTLLAERLTGNAREWWIARRESQSSVPNCWIRPERDYRDVNNPMISFKELLENQFGNPLEQEMAMHQLDALTWDRDTESLNMFKTRASSLFLKARVNSWLMQRGYILKAFSTTMRERILQPASADELWKLAYNIVITDDSIKASKPTAKESKRVEKDRSDVKKGKDLKEVECFNCHEKGHYAPQCPNKDKSEKSSRRRKKDKSDDKEDRKSDDDVCFKCGGRGHRSTECPSSKTYKEGDDAKRKRSTSPPQKKSTAKLHYDTRPVDSAPQLGQDWRPFHHMDIKPSPPPPSPTSQPFYAFEVKPQRAKLFDPPVDSDVIWDDTQFVNASAYYYYNDERQFPQPPFPPTAAVHNLVTQLPPPPTPPVLDVSTTPVPPTIATTAAPFTTKPSAESINSTLTSVETMLTAPPAGRAAGSMRTITKSVTGDSQSTVLDSGTGVCVVPLVTIEKSGFSISRPSDVVLAGADLMESTPLGICDAYQFRINDVAYMVRVYVVKHATFALLLGNEFLWAAGAALFPRWGAFALTIPVAQFLTATCDVVPDLSATGAPTHDIDPKSGEPIVIPVSSKPILHFDVRVPSTVPFLKIAVTDDAISIGERDYIKEVEPDEDDYRPPQPDDLVPVFTDAYVRSRIDISPTAPSWFVDAVIGNIIKYNAAISWTDYDLGKVTEHPHDIELVADTKAVRQTSRPYLYSPKNAEIIRRKTQPLIKLGIWTPCPPTEWCAQLVIAKKERICHDFTDLNKVTVFDAYPIVPMNTIMARLAGKGRFSIFDADRGFLQITHTRRAMLRTAFELLGRLYCSTRMLFGEVNAPATFMRNMAPMIDGLQEQILEKMPDSGESIDNYFDDVILSGMSEGWNDHLRSIELLLVSAISRGWKFKASKIRIAYEKLKVLGVIISATGKSPDPTKVDALLSMRRPRTSSELKSFLGLAHWFGDHVPALAWQSKHLHAMCTQKGVLEWSEVSINAWEYIRRTVRRSFRMALWDYRKTTILYTDASLDGLGALIAQLQDDGTLCVIAFASASLTSAQQNYHITRLEALAFVWSLGHFHVYLSYRPFLWRTDHRALKFIFDASKTKIPVLQRYKMVADEYRFCTEWIEGSKMIADPLSRLCIIPSDKHCAMTNREIVMAALHYYDVDIERLKKIRAHTTDHRVDFFNTIPARKSTTPVPNQDSLPMNLRGKVAFELPPLTGPEMLLIRACGKIRQYLVDGTVRGGEDKRMSKHVKSMAKSCYMSGGVLYKRRRNVIIREVADTHAKRKEVIAAAHDGSGHKGIEGTLGLVGARWWFPVMQKIVARHIARCSTCQFFAKPPSLDNPNFSINVYDVFSHWYIDTAGPFPPDENGNRYVIIALDSLSRWAEITPAKTSTAAEAANFMYYHIVCRFGIPRSIQSDNGTQYVNEVIERLTTILHIRHRFSTPYYPQSNGRVERVIGTLKSMMVKCVQDVERRDDGIVNWVPAVYTALYVYRASPHHSTGVSPSFLIFGEDIRLPLHFNYKPPPPKDQVTHKKQVLERLEFLKTVIPGLRSSHYQFAVNREGRKVLVRPAKYNVGELVLMRNYRKASAISSPFILDWVGPYKIHSIGDKGAYQLQTVPPPGTKRPGLLKKLVNWSKLRRYFKEDDDEFVGEGEAAGGRIVDITDMDPEKAEVIGVVDMDGEDGKD